MENLAIKGFSSMNNNTGKKGVIVIDSEIYSGVTCSKWGQDFPNIAEFKIAILNMTEINHTEFNQEGWLKFSNMVTNLRNSNGKIFFIINENSYFAWDSKFQLKTVKEKGMTVRTVNQEYAPYNDLIPPWSFYFDEFFEITQEGNRISKQLKRVTNICMTSFNKGLFIEYQGNYYLPKPGMKSVSNGIEILLREILKVPIEKTQSPIWINKINLPGDLKLKSEIIKIDSEIETLESKKQNLFYRVEQRYS